MLYFEFVIAIFFQYQSTIYIRKLFLFFLDNFFQTKFCNIARTTEGEIQRLLHLYQVTNTICRFSILRKGNEIHVGSSDTMLQAAAKLAPFTSCVDCRNSTHRFACPFPKFFVELWSPKTLLVQPPFEKHRLLSLHIIYHSFVVKVLCI